MTGLFSVEPSIMAKVNTAAFLVGMLAYKAKVPTFYNIGAEVIGVAGKTLIKGYATGEVRRLIDVTLRWQALGIGKSDERLLNIQREMSPRFDWPDARPRAFGIQLGKDNDHNLIYNTKSQNLNIVNYERGVISDAFFTATKSALSRLTDEMELNRLIYTPEFTKWVLHCRLSGRLDGVLEDFQDDYAFMLLKQHRTQRGWKVVS